ncbi:hypothetical protein BBBOND_0305140 [Babesia bigemina]|uniref:Uncharacterized protein n=1 Tax=Babesia bigemina TaxID=5866 RepID=A0A061D7C4_BABBI|nr:hypothetical protein BBBOND_0305140 [Babesia bigemina]CDR96611.1 hypothetical protein BBBOND_0305140 [Babesia bigemina]|eukprot:XP_012768797.1 hypothetical protein BBBOND_0305140 [Babesia bigemina]
MVRVKKSHQIWNTGTIDVASLPVIDPKLKPPEDFDRRTIKRPDIVLCLAPWATSKPAHDSTDIPETELFSAKAPRTVRDMLQWLAGFKNEKHHDTLKQCIKRAFGGLHKDTSQLALFINHAKIRPGDVFDILQLTAMFAGSVLTAIASNCKENVPSRFVKPKSSDQSDDPDCCALFCQLRDYAYACHHYAVKQPSPLQAFLTDDWDSTFDTHPFDPCNLCHKSRVRMGFRTEDLPKTSQQGSVISTILTPSSGGEGHDALLDTK